MNTNKIIHPGVILKKYLIERGFSQRKLSKWMGVSYQVVNEICNGRSPVTARMAILIEREIGLSAYTLVEIQARYDVEMLRKLEANSISNG